MGLCEVCGEGLGGDLEAHGEVFWVLSGPIFRNGLSKVISEIC